MSVQIDVDLRDKLGEVRDQRQRPTCLVFAVSSAHEVSRGNTEYLSPEYLFYSGVQRSHKDPSIGLTKTAVRDALLLDGQPVEAAWPYLHETPKAEKWKAPTLAHPVQKATIDFVPRSLVEIRQVLGEGKPVLLVVAITVAMYQPDKDAIVRSRANDTITTRRHVVLAVGSGHADDGDYILVRNSWGEHWGKAGHGWLHDPYLTPQLQTTGVIA